MKTRLTLVSCLALPALLAAQTDKVVPSLAASAEGNDVTSYPFGRTSFRSQQIFDGSYLATSFAIINSISYRGDNDNSGTKPAMTLPNVRVNVSDTTVSPTTMSATYAANITGVPSTVFVGAISLPAYTPSSGGVAPFNIVVPFNSPFASQTYQSNVLVDITATGANASSGYAIDSALPGGIARFVGQSGPTSNSLSRLQLVVQAANGTTGQGRFGGLVPGGSIVLAAQSETTAYQGAIWFGLSRYASPISLGFIGAPDNEVYVENLMDVAFTMGTGVRYSASIPLPIPNNNGLIGVPIYSQAVVSDPSANALGFVTTNAQEMIVGEPLPHPTRMVRGTDPLALTGSYNYSSGILGGPVVRFNGVFN